MGDRAFKCSVCSVKARMKSSPEGRGSLKKMELSIFHKSISTQTPWPHIVIRPVKELSLGGASFRRKRVQWPKR